MEKKLRISPYIIAILAVFLVVGNGCKESFFEGDAGDRITPDQHYKSVQDGLSSAQGALVSYQDIVPQLILLNGLRSDLMEVTPNAEPYLREINYHTLSGNNPFADASPLYQVIININEVLKHIDKIAETDKEYDELTSYQAKGVLIGLRAYTYLTLIRLYNKASYIESNYETLPDNLYQNVLNREELLDILIKQMEAFFESELTSSKYEALRLEHYPNNKAVLGELYLESGMYAEAAQWLKDACEYYDNQVSSSEQRSLLKVDQSYKDEGWASIFLNSASQRLENMMVVPYTRSEGQFNPLAEWLLPHLSYLVKPTSIVIDSMMSQVQLNGDTLDGFRGPVNVMFQDMVMNPDSTYSYINPYINKYSVDVNNPESSDIILSRAADIHLMLAEAFNRMGDEESQKYALMLLNQGVNNENPKPPLFSRWTNNLGIRGRAYLKSREVPERDSIPLEERTLLIEDLIIAERAMELAFEGKRWFDLVRIAERRNDPAYLADKVAAKFEGTEHYEAVRNRLMNPESWYLPFE
mgnify:CR=1 FL=1